MWRLFARPALFAAGKILKALDKDGTGLDDKIGDKLIELSQRDDLDDLLQGKNISENFSVEIVTD